MSIGEIVISIMLALSIALSGLTLVVALRKRNSVTGNNENFSKTQEDFITERSSQLFTLLNASVKSESEKITVLTSTGQDTLRKIIYDYISQSKSDYNQLKNSIELSLNNIRQTMSTELKDSRQELTEQSKLLEKSVVDNLEKIRDGNEKKLNEMTLSNEKKLNEIQNTVEEKLQKTLHDRINSSFSAVSSQLAEVQKGLGEMQNLTANVSDLNKVLNGVKVRGIWGEVSLESLLEQILSSTQYATQVNIKGKNIVDFAIIMPGKDNEKVYLPIDAKFPYTSYEELSRASENGDKDGVTKARSELLKAIKTEAKSISSKYIDIPKTTNFAIMYLPIEGLYSEVARDAQLMTELHNAYNIMVAGPTTLTALLTALQVGFRTVTIQKQSKEVWNALQGFKKNIGNFVNLMNKSKSNAEAIVSDMETSLKKVFTIEKSITKLGDYQEDTLAIQSEVEDGV